MGRAVHPGAALIGFAFAGAGLGLTTYMRSFFDFDYVGLAIVPLFLFSATFFPLDQYPPVLEWVVRVSPLYQGVAIERALVLARPPRSCCCTRPICSPWAGSACGWRAAGWAECCSLSGRRGRLEPWPRTTVAATSSRPAA